MYHYCINKQLLLSTKGEHYIMIKTHIIKRMRLLLPCIIMLSMAFAPSTSADCVRSLEQTLSELGRTLPKNTITVSNVSELFDAVDLVNETGGNRTILLEDGTYDLGSERLSITADNVTFRSLSGDRDKVEIFGEGMYGGFQLVFEVAGDYFTVADMTIGEVRNHAIQIHGEFDADFPLVHNVRFVNTGEQMLKVSYKSGDSRSSDNGLVEWCVFEYTAGIGPRYYIGGVDVHQGHNWVVRNNVLRSIRSPESGLAEHAIHFWSKSSHTVVEKNLITNCDRGIGFGLGDSGHIGGMIRNNMVHTTRDVGIGLENSSGTKVYNNTVFTENYINSIEYRFPGTQDGFIINNLTNQSITSRSGGSATVRNNMINAQASWFVNPTNGNLHLITPVPLSVVNQGETLSEVVNDFDCELRPQQGAYDIGADEIGSESDSDGDDITDDVDNCPNIPNPSQVDTDNDGFGDACDTCPNDADNDSDQDGICGDVDNCPNTSNPSQVDTDNDGIGDECDTCPNDADNDSDQDGICGDVDNCPNTSNPSQVDTDNDGFGDACDTCPNDADNDSDQDGICGDVDNCPNTSNPSQVDTDNDGLGDECDNCADVYNPDQTDTDGDGIGDACEELVGDVLISKEQEFQVDRGGSPELPYVYQGDTISYNITATNMFNSPVTLLISDALSALVDYVAGTLKVDGETVENDSLYFDDYLLEYESSPMDEKQSLTISFDVIVADDAFFNEIIENFASVTAFVAGSSADPLIVNKPSNILQAQVKNPVPEPATLIFVSTGLLGIFVLVRRRQQKR
jgi:uncharacterized repeat protein (TIGR01451 family)